jgi:hypothetical protein
MLEHLIPAAVGACLALLASYLTNRSNAARLILQLQHERSTRVADLRREHAEELFTLAEHWLTGLTLHLITHSKVMSGELTYDQANDLTIERGAKDSNVNVSRLEMLIKFYFPSLLPAWNRVVEMRDEANELINAHKRAYRRGRAEDKYLEPLISIIRRLPEANENLRLRIIELGQSLDPSSSQTALKL